jgi:transposase
MNCKIIGIDLAKNVFQVCLLGEDNKVISNKKIPRAKLLHTLRQLPESIPVAMEACGASHHWARQLQDMGMEVKLLPAQHVKAFAGHQKNDAIDALAICEAAQRPSIHSVPVKTIEQQDIKALRCTRQQWVDHRTALGNQIRGLSTEYGVIFSRSLAQLRCHLPEAAEDEKNGLSSIMRQRLREAYQELCDYDVKIKTIERQLHMLCQQQSNYRPLLEIPGIGPLISAALISELGDGSQFSNGRQMSAWCGLVPRQHSSGDRTVSLGITKNGNQQLRTLLIHGARAVVFRRHADGGGLSRWISGLVERRGKHKAIVALANKLARVCWAVIRSEQSYNQKRAFA